MQLGFGCARLGSASSGARHRDATRLVRDAVEQGVTVFDTADAYGAGASERLLGNALRGVRSQVTIATKGGYVFRPRTRAEQRIRRAVRAVAARRPMSGTPAPSGSAYGPQDFSPANLRRRLHDSLRRLRTDHVDLYQLHGPHELLPELLEALSDLVADGKVLRLGVGAESVSDAARWADVPGLDALQLPFGVLDPEAADDVFPAARARSVEIWARGVLGGGLLAAFDRDDPTMAGEPKRHQIAALRDLAAESGLDPYQLAVGFVRAHRDVSTVLLGIGSRGHLERNLELMRQPALDEDLVARIRRLGAQAVVAPIDASGERSS